MAATPLLGNSMGTIDNYVITPVVRNATLYDVDPATGAQTNPRDLGISGLVGITSGPGGVLYGLTSGPQKFPPETFANSLVRIDPVTGATTVVGPTGLAGLSEGDIKYNPANGLLYGLTNGANNLFTLNPATGQATVIGEVANTTFGDPSAIAFSPTGTLYVLDYHFGGEQDIIWGFDSQTLANTSFALLNLPIGPFSGMDFDPATGTLYVADGGGVGGMFGDNALYTLNPTTGQLTLVGGVGPFTTLDEGLAGLTFVVPEPASLSLLAVAGLALFRRRRQSSVPETVSTDSSALRPPSPRPRAS